MVVLATAATVIASQAVITGAYSLVRQAIQLGLLPRLAILHTSAAHSGQIYMPRVNTALLVGVLLLVGLFRTSSALASAYGIAVADHHGGRRRARLHRDLEAVAAGRCWQAALLMVPLVIVDATFFSRQPAEAARGRLGAAAVRHRHGAADPDLAARHRASSRNKTRTTEVPLDALLRSLEKKPPHIVPGTAVFLTSDPEFAPTALLHNLKHNKVLHEQNVILTIVTADTPRVREEERVTITPVSRAFHARGADASATWRRRTCRRRSPSRASTAGTSTSCRRRSSCRGARSSRRRIPACRAGRTGCSSGWPSSASDATDFFQIPTGRVVEVGTQVTV